MGITYEEADKLIRKVRKQRYRVVASKPTDLLKCAANSMRRRGLKPVAFYISVDVDDRRRPKVREMVEINRIVKVYADRDWIPVAIFTGKTPARHDHVIAYDHKRKRLCDTNTRGMVWHLSEHPLKHDYLHGIMVVGKEFYE